MIEAMVKYGEYLAKKENLDLDSFENLVREALIQGRREALEELMNFFKFAIDSSESVIIYIYDDENGKYYLADENIWFRIFPITNLSGKVANALKANHPVLTSKSIKKYNGVIIQKSDLDRIRKDILKTEFNSSKYSSLSDQEKEKLREMIVGKVQKLLHSSGIYLQKPDVRALIEKFEINKKVSKIVIIPKSKINEIDVRRWIIEKFLFGDKKPSLSSKTYNCPLCGRAHHWTDIKLFFPINVQSEKTLNFLSNLSPEGKQIVCITCAYKLLRLTHPETQFIIKSKYHANILAYPYGYTEEGTEVAENVLKELSDSKKSSEGLFALPEIVWNITNRENVDLIFGEINSSELWLYIVAKGGQAERVIASYHITDFSKLAQLGKYQNQINQFQRTIGEYMGVLKGSSKKNQHKIVVANMLASMYANFDVLSLNTSFIKHITKTIIQKSKNPQLYGKYFISLYLSTCGGDSLSERRSIDAYREIYNFGVTLGELWRQLAEADKTRFNSYKAKVMKLDTPNINVLSDTVRYMIQKIAEELSDEKVGTLFSRHRDFPKIVTDTKARELFVTGTYFGFFSPLKKGGEKT